MEVMYVDRSFLQTMAVNEVNYLQKPSVITSLTPDLAEAIRRNPLLHTIHVLREPFDFSGIDHFARLDELETPDELWKAGRVTSMRHGGEELLILHLHMDCFELADERFPHSGAKISSSILGSIEYTKGTTGERRQKTLVRSSPSWQTFTNFRSLTIPMRIIETMWEIEGVEKGNWKRRNRVDVSARAWSVLLSWHEGFMVGYAKGLGGEISLAGVLRQERPLLSCIRGIITKENNSNRSALRVCTLINDQQETDQVSLPSASATSLKIFAWLTCVGLGYDR